MRTVSLLFWSALAAGAGLLYAKDALAKYEEPNYQVENTSGNIQTRKYPAVIAAEVTVKGSRDRAANEAFSILAGYIFGKNQQREKVAMTVPVTEILPSEKIAMTVPVIERTKSDTMTMQFYMPSKYSLDDLPKPNDSRISFLKVPARRYAVIQFSGVGNERNLQRHESLLLEHLDSIEIPTSGDAIRAFYNPPWTLPFLRRNEVWIQLADK